MQPLPLHRSQIAGPALQAGGQLDGYLAEPLGIWAGDEHPFPHQVLAVVKRPAAQQVLQRVAPGSAAYELQVAGLLPLCDRLVAPKRQLGAAGM